MTRLETNSKLVLVETRQDAEPERPAPGLRRYRLARLRLESRSTDPARRFQHIERVYD